MDHVLFTSVDRPTDMTTPVELRLDLCTADRDAVVAFLKRASAPVLLTVRQNVEEWLALAPPFLDVPSDYGALHAPASQLIRSHHDFEGTPQDLEALFCSMQKHSASLYKIAALANSSCDALRLLLFKKRHPHLSVIAMGEKGSFARVLGPCVGGQIGFGYLKGGCKTAPGQIAAADLRRIYRYDSLSPKTALYGLIGHPVHKSQGHLYHNGVFHRQKRDAVYVKIDVEPHELRDFFALAKEIGFQGLSVTAPLKEAVLPFLDEIDEEAKAIGSVNTIVFRKNGLFGCNTDGKAALDVLEKRGGVQGKTIVLLGAGGAARAIAFEAKKRGANTVVLNRSDTRNRDGALHEMPNKYDILINTTPFVPQKMVAFSFAMDIIYSPRHTPFLKQAARAGCRIVYGKEMFLAQAAMQSAWWSAS